MTSSRIHHLQVTFVSPDGIWAIRFGGEAQYAAFTEKYNDKLFENTFKVDNDETNRNKVGNVVLDRHSPLRLVTIKVVVHCLADACVGSSCHIGAYECGLSCRSLARTRS